MPTLRHFARTALAVLALTTTASSVAATQAETARIDTGELRGNTHDGVIAFKGIPFAAPPVGALRWRAPQPASAWSGVRDATQYGADCMQLPFPSDAAPLGTAPAEDCLYANVWKPAKARGKLPVLVWIYGGGFVNGGASPPTYAGAALARQGIVVMSFNYRVGRFGTFAHPQLTAQHPDGALLANYGFMDQLAALQWVQRNIAAFGGDPAQVTIIGESAGGMSVHTLLTSPMTKGLFQRAVIQSGGDGGAYKGDVVAAEQISVAFAASKGIAADDPQALEKLRALPADTIVGGLNLASLFTPTDAPRTFSAPVVDGTLSVDSAAAYASGQFNTVPVMLGATSDDIGGRDGFMIAGARKAADVFVGHGVPTYYYRFSYVADSTRTPQTAGASHASDIPFFFDTVDIKYGAQATAKDRGVGRLASSYLVNFVKHGDPNGKGLPQWPAYDAKAQPMLDFNADGKTSTGRDPLLP
ncbi:para-nitrobenzyl esterase [Pseudoxanthomonas sp. GM95]|uniref:carboxylesterase/lipase family protein n=1 Tax=Pseudoxanthomonas sp. GM95 TaxID=1881043 RepID=UPI0008AAAFAB|nr:carboxylesterase family protein [Pseudoxanthomonas sp. GM95]SEL58321.1 para-nitrobenzyl esterase [Pseudoxanthomonas sp. GM95]